jgi:hypothetical protein
LLIRRSKVKSNEQYGGFFELQSYSVIEIIKTYSNFTSITTVERIVSPPMAKIEISIPNESAIRPVITPYFVFYFTAKGARVSQCITKEFYLFPFFYPLAIAGGN